MLETLFRNLAYRIPWVLLALGALAPRSFPQSIVWSRLSGSAGYEGGHGVAVDVDGNAYVVGSKELSFDYDNTPAIEDISLIKYDGVGKKLWTRFLGSKCYASASAIAVDARKSIFLAGGFADSLHGERGAGGTDVFLAKLDSTGKRIWTRVWGTPGSEYDIRMALGRGGNIYLAGSTDSTFDRRPRVGISDVFLLKYDSSGRKLWSRWLGTAGRDRAAGIALDARENAYVAANIDSASTGHGNGDRADFLLAKFNGAGEKQWEVQSGTDTPDHAESVAADADGCAYVLNSAKAASGGGYDYLGDGKDYYDGVAMLSKFDAKGALVWKRVVSGSSRGASVALDSLGAIYVTGIGQGGWSISRTEGDFLAKYDRGGKKHWIRFWGLYSIDPAGGIAIDRDGFVYMAGSTDDHLAGNRNAGHRDIALIKYAPFAPSFDCRLAATLQEELICRSPILSDLDTSLAHLFAAALKSSPMPSGLKARQTRWLEKEFRACSTQVELVKCMQRWADTLKTAPARKSR